MNSFNLAGKTALVTGGNTGIGLGMVRGLAEAGADIIVSSRSIEKSGSEVEKIVTDLGRKFTAIPCDFSNRDSLYDFTKKVLSEHGVPDILVNNAGTIMRAPAAEHPDEYWDNVLNINLNAPFLLAREFGKEMVARGSGKIIFTCSLLTFQGGITVPGYAASKGALGSLVKALSNEWAAKGLNVNGIAPGYIRTNNTDALQKDPVRNEAILSRIPAGRWGEPEDFAGPTVFLASNASNYVNGTILTVDGGWMGR
ncbi:MAG: SDR family oxidoreductase [Spirosomaceae bacterium]|nr:SDR family oxidoreductase [Spirosomataceae bacterium]